MAHALTLLTNFDGVTFFPRGQHLHHFGSSRLSRIGKSHDCLTGGIEPRARRPHGLIAGVGKPTIRTILVPRWATIALLVLLSLGMAALIAMLSGRAYLRQQLTIREAVSLIHRYDRGALSNDALLATAAPGIADILFFMPWGALAFLAFDGGETHRFRTYLLTLAVGVTFALGLVAWQSALPKPVTGWEDAGWSTLGCLAGAVIGHLRKRLQIRFD